ncbi:putative CAP-GLY domain-containing protein [Monocercomonoides exilis]|uniref:putative CAP-GLY domain-containing protein n=1 Tax=Monocercomonoides exilis TaxID=2049356 RepID=UPI003559DD06|nr:putative CAP-GLY domain-containing protein [Monocercomonoides exilis]|eukprot:MONOS_9133.1-p1 / transcript=MONOS_9133.1 / gene=MONOS_9133 / organism=Monocercomonoides_exilis_PA203 / gene_product=CAP-GLY domain-containing protein / transcript_product=CAP-GLY domain-containing protein / location=Mono_scaffold00367:47727-48969(-) / protein_length=228 / sequence_SO=supercontig / SO=protein_coding / is_pseudo=false
MSHWYFVTSSSMPIRTEKKFNDDISILKLKTSLYSIIGIPASCIKLQLKDEEGTVIADDLDNNKCLNDYEIFDHAELHAVDTSPTNSLGDLTDVSKVEKFKISEEEYNKRDDSFRKFKEQNKELFAKQKAFSSSQPSLKEENDHDSISEDQIGKRCRISGDRRGVIRFVGELPGKSGLFVGIELDEPIGKNDGSFEGKKIFECAEKHGIFVRNKDIEVGDFPELDLDF